MIIIGTLILYFVVFLIISRLSRWSRWVLLIATFVTIGVSCFYAGFILQSIFSDRPNPVLDNKMAQVESIFAWIWILAGILILAKIIKNVYDSISLQQVDIPTEVSTTMTINEKISIVNTSEKNTVVFLFSKSSPIKIISPTLTRIICSIIQESGKNNFEPFELKNNFEYIRDHYNTHLSSDDYNKVLSYCEKFMNEGGRLELTIS